MLSFLTILAITHTIKYRESTTMTVTKI